MLVVKYLLATCLVAAGLFAFSKRDVLQDAYEWSPTVEKSPFPSFDPKAVADASRIPVPDSGITVVKGADTRGVPVPRVEDAAPAPQLTLTGGSAALAGTVVGPGGELLSDAVVRVERFEGTASVAVDLRTDGSGTFRLNEALGGRYRVRAWRAPTYAQDGSEVTFVTDGEQRNFRLQLAVPSGDELRVGIDATRVIVGQTTSVGVRVRGPYVNDNGQVTFGGKAGREITITGSGVLTGLAGTRATDGEGFTAFTIACNQIGEADVTVTSAIGSRSFSISCIPVPTTTTTTASTSTTPRSPTAGPTPSTAPVATTTTRAG